MTGSTRRDVLRAGGVAVAAAGALPSLRAGTAWGSPKRLDLPPRDDIGHLLSRLTFGVDEAEDELARRLGYEGYLDRQLDWESIDSSELEDGLHALLPTLSMSLRDLIALARDPDPDRRTQAFREFQLATLLRAVHSPRQLYEVMVELWGNHFAVAAIDGPLRTLKPWEDRDVMRRHALGRFPELLAADARSPAMLYYLDNITNVAGGPNENYARELLELHTLGVDGGYTETDVQEVARIFTGWSLRPETGAFRFYPARHDHGAKRVLGVDFPAGRGESEGTRLLGLLANHESTARHVACKLAVRFAADEPPANLVEKVAGSFADSGGDIRSTLRTLFLSSEFLAARDAKLKRPFEYVVSVLRATRTAVSRPGYRELYETLRRLGQVPYGWPAPDGFPDTAGHWIATSSLLGRANFALGLADGSLARFFDLSIPYGSLPETPAGIVDALARRIVRRELSADDRELLVAYAADGRDPAGGLPGKARVQAVRGVLGLLLVSRYVQLR